jgi:protein-S-isoprenylcysteine O-methyltransferase Ste14
MRAVEIVFLVGWVVFWLGWFLAAARAKPGRIRWGRGMGVRVVITVIILTLNRGNVSRTRATVHSPWLEAVGLALFAAGLGFAVWARVHLGRNWGMPMSQKADPELVTTGPYGLARHPVYTGIVLAMVGTAVALSPYWLFAVAIIAGYFVYSATREERYMAELFPDTYPDYRRSTKMLVPFVF